MYRKLTLVLGFSVCLSSWTIASAQSNDEAHGLKDLAIYSPRPSYPYEARDQRMEGSGTVLVKVDSRTGYVTSAQMFKSTGHKILDEAALEAFRRWRFRPNMIVKAKIPVNFTMRGVRY